MIVRAFAFAFALVTWTPSALARTGTGDPVEIFREHAPDDVVLVHGQLRLRSALYLNLDLDRGAAPSNGLPLFAEDALAGHDARVRFSPSVFLGDVRLFLDTDLAEASLGPAPDGVPFAARPRGVSDGSASFVDVRALGFDWMLPIGVISIGRMPAHFALGIAANDGAGIDDDGGDRAERISLVMPLFGSLLAIAADALPQDTILGEQALSLGFMQWRAPWEVELRRDAGRTVLDWGAAVSLGGSSQDVPGLHARLQDALVGAGLRAPPASLRVRRDTRFLLADAWARLVVDRFRVEGEAWVGDLVIDNPSPFAGVTVRTPIVGNPAAFSLVFESRLLEPSSDALLVQLEVGAASADPAPGFPIASPPSTSPLYASGDRGGARTSTPPAFSGAGAGDVFGPQITLKNDMRFDAARLQPLHRVDLILWRTLLGGVSEAAYARVHLEGELYADGADDTGTAIRLDANLVYSHALSADSAPGGVAPLGVELDVGAEGTLGDASLRIDAGSLLPLGGLGARGAGPASMGHMLLVRLGYAL